MRDSLLAALLALATTAAHAQVAPAAAAATVLEIDAAWQAAKLKADLAALARLTADGFYEINQNGNGRNRKEALQGQALGNASTGTEEG